jgi:hypothetical protein
MKTYPSSCLLAALVGLFLAGCGGDDSGGSTSTPGGGSGTPTNPNPPPPPPPADPVFFFGAQAHFGQGWNVNLVPRITAGGMADVRDELYWEIVETSTGNFNFPASYDRYMTALKDAGISPLIELTFENPLYDGGQTPYTTAGFNGYARYATEVLRKYGTQIKAVEIWNEYNGTFAKGPATADRAANYLKLLQAAHAAIKSARPDVTVVAGSTAGVPLPYFEKLFAAGALNYLDVVSVHPYRSASAPEGLEVQIAALQSLMAKYGAVKPIWVTEIGWPLHASQATGDLEVNETVQAQFLVRAFALLASAGVPRVYWYELRDDSADPVMGLVQNDAGYTARRAHAAMRTLNAQLRTASFSARERTAANVYSLRFTSPGGRELRVLWALSPLSVPVPSGTTVVDLVGNPVAATGGSITVGESPVYVSGPLPGLAGASTARPVAAITDSEAAFSLQQGNFGWQYGYFVGPDTNFTALKQTRITDWKEEWIDAFASISVTNVDQHPSATPTQPVSVVRRWVSSTDGNVRVTAHFKVGLEGDGVRVRVLADGQVLHSATLSRSTSIVADFSFTLTVRNGTTLDFAVDPGAARNLGNDATQVSVTIEQAF